MSDTPLNRHLAEGKASEIQADIAYGRFDTTLNRYRDDSDGSTNQCISIADLFTLFIDHKRREGLSGQSIAAKYNPLLSNLKRVKNDIHTIDDAREVVDVLRGRQSPRIANQNLTLLKSFGEWMVKAGHREFNPFESIRPMKGASIKVQNRKPFTLDEVRLLIETVRIDPIHYRYHDFMLTLFSLGLRPSEAIGLRWKHIDLERLEVTIAESLSRSSDGRSAGYARQRKTTKTENIRVLPMSQRLAILFAGRRPVDANPDDLVFTTATGKPVDDRMFRERVWKRICNRAGVEYRPPYTARHTLLSHGIESEGWTLQQAARIAGHSSTRMVADTYGHMINRPRLPEF
jgi:integrase